MAAALSCSIFAEKAPPLAKCLIKGRGNSIISSQAANKKNAEGRMGAAISRQHMSGYCIYKKVPVCLYKSTLSKKF